MILEIVQDYKIWIFVIYYLVFAYIFICFALKHEKQINVQEEID